MNDQELLQRLNQLGYSYDQLGQLVGTSRQAIQQALGSPETTFFRKRPDRLFELKKVFDRRRNVRGLALVNAYIQEHFPDALRAERHLCEYEGLQWSRIELIAPRMEDFGDLLAALGWGWPFDDQERNLHLLLGSSSSSTALLTREVAEKCRNHLPRNYWLHLAQGAIPTTLPPLVRVDRNRLYQLGDEGFLPVPTRQRTTWESLLEQNNLRWSEPCFIEGGVSGNRMAQASDGRRHGLLFEPRPGIRIELGLERIDQLGWWLRLRGTAPAGNQLRLFDGGGHLWVDTPTEALPWGGRWPYGDADPGPYLEELQLQLLEPDHDDRTQR